MVSDRGGVVGVDGSENGNHMVVRGGGNGSGSVSGSGSRGGKGRDKGGVDYFRPASASTCRRFIKGSRTYGGVVMRCVRV